jgi:hypothetical protein
MLTGEMPVEKKIFAIKMDPRDKEAMDFVSRETGATLASLHMDSIRKRLLKNLGYVLLHGLHGEGAAPGDMALLIGNESEAFRRKPPLVVLNFINLIREEGNLGRLGSLFPGVELDPSAMSAGSLDMGRLSERVAAAYLEADGPFDPPDQELVLDAALEVMLESSYMFMARGSLSQLMNTWEDSQTLVLGFRLDLVAQYQRAHPLERTGGGPGPRTRKAPSASKKPGRKRKGRKKLAKEEAVEVVEVSPVMEVDELDD